MIQLSCRDSTIEPTQAGIRGSDTEAQTDFGYLSVLLLHSVDQNKAFCVCHTLFFSEYPGFCTLFCFLWLISPGCPFSLLKSSSGFPSATCVRTETACCTSNKTERPPAPLALLQRRLDTETGSHLPMGSSAFVCLCVCVCVWQGYKSFHSSCHAGTNKSTWGGLYIVVFERKFFFWHQIFTPCRPERFFSKSFFI